MNLSTFEPDEIKKLIELAYLGEWVINAQHDNDFQDDLATRSFQKLLEAAQLPEIERDVETNELYLPTEWTDRLYDQYVLDYDDHVFWDELIERLAQRDLARQRGVAIELVDRDDDLPALRPLEEHYRHELERQGIERLELADDF